MDGILLIDKPRGWTSFDVVAKVRGTLKHGGVPKAKVGHTGTLDPLATGLLVLVVGEYCKRAGEFSKLDKVYEAEVTLGATSTTDDDEGEKTAVSDQEPEVVLEPRPITIYEITGVNYVYPRVSFTIGVSSGTYIRSLARDLGSKLGTGAYLSGLRRTEVGKFKITNTISPEELTSDRIYQHLQDS
jgi:tRNA pseudouridine55 synthase